MVESMIKYSRSGSSPNSVKSCFQTPLCPAPEAPEHTVPFAELFGQVTPRRTSADQPQHSVNEQTIVLAVPTPITFLAWNKRLDAPPLRVREPPPNQDRPPKLRS
jgi:hypothetical protein